jgi:glucans biosynthesis protein
MHGGAKGSGAPCGNKNALKHGSFTKHAIELRATLRKQIRQAQGLLKALRRQ